MRREDCYGGVREIKQLCVCSMMFSGGVFLLFLIVGVTVHGSAPPTPPKPPPLKKIDPTPRPTKQPIYGVSMIVRNEKKILPRLFASLKPFVTYYCICDTGSVDGTAEYVVSWLKEQQVHGAVHKDPWVSFSWNRNMCLDKIRKVHGLTHILLMDADFVLQVHDVKGFAERGPPSDQNMIAYSSSLFHRQPLIITPHKRCGYLGRTHERLMCVDNDHAFRLLLEKKDHTRDEREQIEEAAWSGLESSVGIYDDVTIYHHHDGSRRPYKFTEDAELLAEDLRHDPYNAWNWFYYAQSLENGRISQKEAFEAYSQRVALGGYEEQVWYSMYRMGFCKLNVSDASTIEDAARYFIDAFDYNPRRREPLYALARFYRLAEKYTACKMFATQALQVPFPPSEYGSRAFSIEVDVYEWRVMDELSVCLDNLGDTTQAVKLIQAALDYSKKRGSATTLDNVNKERLEENLKALTEKQKYTMKE